ncbi:MAG: hydroxymethylbilane synthase [Chloroflexi bacterium]|nr:hydroxymethylbilane synthase [Chloroflexota bacterium]
MTRIVRIGTRRSQLSHWQAQHVANLIAELRADIRIEIREYSTRGDRLLNQPLPTIGGKGVFTQALEKALLHGEIDCAVHSLKDLPVDNTRGLALAAIPKRGDHRDALVSRGGERLTELPAGARIGTGSPRRRAQLLALRSDLHVVDIRGNVPTRINKLQADGSYDALVLAAAGLQRLGMEASISQVFDEAQMLCAAGQGALAVQCRVEDSGLFSALTHSPSALAVAAERAFLRGLQAGCALPVGAYAVIRDDTLSLQGSVMSLDGRAKIKLCRQVKSPIRDESLTTAVALGEAMAKDALTKGAGELLGASHEH